MQIVGLSAGFGTTIRHKSAHVLINGAMSDSLYIQSQAITVSILVSTIPLRSSSIAGSERAESVSQSKARKPRFLDRPGIEVL